MTPSQHEALVGVVGRPLTEAEAQAIEPLLVTRDDPAIADILSKNRTALVSKYIGTGTILSKMKGLGGQFLDALVVVGEKNRDAYWAMDLIKAGRFDVGDPSSQQQLDGLAQLFPQFAEGLAAVKSVGRVDDPVATFTVSEALNKAQGAA